MRTNQQMTTVTRVTAIIAIRTATALRTSILKQFIYDMNTSPLIPTESSLRIYIYVT